MRSVLLFVLVTISSTSANESEPPRTRIKQGEIIGTTYETYSGRKVDAFYGLPFAAPPVKERRFQPPHPPESWDKPKVATNRSDFCVQAFLPGLVTSVGSEDCLYLDVYTPKVPKNGVCEKLYPVLFYVHPSAAILLSGTTNEPYYMMDKYDIVFVPVNYRLGILGFLTTDDEVVPGNNLFKDQVMALKWVQENIRSFCGDPQQVTFSGSSEGSLSGAFHMISPLSKGLFHRVIGVSASAFIYFNFHAEGKEVGKTVANQLNCPTANSKEMVECLKLKNADLFWDLDLQFRPFFLLPLEVFGGTIERCHKDAFLSKTPLKALADGDLAQIPMLNIESEYDGNILVYMLAIPGVLEILDLTYKTNLKYFFDLYHMMPPHLFENTSETIKREYFGDGLITGNELGFKKMVTDGIFSQALYEQIIRYARHSNSPMYFFRDCFRGTFSSSQLISLVQTNKNYGASHYDGSLYAVFDGLIDKKFRLKKKDKAMMEFMTELFYSFMVDGKPSVADKLGWTPQPRTGDEIHYLRFENPYRMYTKKEDNYGNRKFWQSLPISRYYGFPDDFCELNGNKSSSGNKARENDTTGENRQAHDCNDENEQADEDRWHHQRQHDDQQNECDQNNEDENHRKIEEESRRQQNSDEEHHRQHDDQQNECDQNNEDENHRKIEEELRRQQKSDEEHHRQDAEKLRRLQQLHKSHQRSHSN